MRRLIINTLLLSAVLSPAWAMRSSAEVLEAEYKDPAKYPLGCRNTGYEFVLNTLSLVHQRDPALEDQEQGGQALFFVYNHLTQPVNLNQMLRDESTSSTYLNHTIQPKQWAVLATNQKEIRYICSINPNKTAYGSVISCADSLKVCEYVRVKFGLNNRGNYWMVDSAPRGTAVGDVVRYGVIPR